MTDEGIVSDVCVYVCLSIYKYKHTHASVSTRTLTLCEKSFDTLRYWGEIKLCEIHADPYTRKLKRPRKKAHDNYLKKK